MKEKGFGVGFAFSFSFGFLPQKSSCIPAQAPSRRSGASLLSSLAGVSIQRTLAFYFRHGWINHGDAEHIGHGLSVRDLVI